MKKTLLIPALALLCLGALGGCSRRAAMPPEEEPKTSEPAEFPSERHFVNAVLFYGDASYGNNLSSITECDVPYYHQRDAPDKITATEGTVRVEYTPWHPAGGAREGPGKACLEWCREGDAARLLEEKISELGLEACSSMRKRPRAMPSGFAS